MTEQLVATARPLGIALALTVASGLADAQGFIHASQIWRTGALVPSALTKSALAFALGMGLQWIAIRFFQQSGVMLVETQTMVWFAATIIGVGLMSGTFFHWAATDRAVAMGVVAGVAWLLVRTGG